jgi:nucleoside-diphosphate-sugar epimerase
MKTVAITGSSGFVGKHLVKRLRNEQCKVIDLDIKDGVDLMSEKIIEKIDKFDLLIHLAARSFVPDSYTQPLSFFKTNYLLTLHALEMCRKHGAALIYFSSYVYGKPVYLPIDENHPTDGFNPYAQTKLIGEELCKSYNRFFNVPVMIIRPFNIYGPGQDSRYLIPKIIHMAATGTIELENPEPKRDFIHINDVVEFIVMVAKKDFEMKCEIFNLGSGTSFTVDEIVRMIVKNKKIAVNYTNKKRPNEITDIICNPNKAKLRFNWHPEASLKEELSKLLFSSKIMSSLEKGTVSY